MIKWDLKSFVIAVIMAFIFITALNLIVSSIFSQIPVIKTGFVFILILAGIVLSMIFVFVSDGRIDNSEIYMFLLILATCVGVFFAIKHYLPQLFSMIPESTKQVFNIFPLP